MSIVRLEKVVREVGTFTILDEINASIAMGERIGLVGPNGAGKTTMLRLIAGFDEPDRGEVGRKRNLRIGILAQESHFDPRFMSAPDLRTAVRHGAEEAEQLEIELAQMEREHRVGEPRYAEAQHRFEVLGGYTLDQRVDQALNGLGFTHDDFSKAPAQLSGGEQTRATLARLVVADPDLLLLDEPTNHLDLNAIEWLEEHLRNRQGALLVTSHDRAFLDNVVERIWELRDRKLKVFRGNYAAYARQREEADARERKDADERASQIAHEKELIQKYRSQRKHVKMHEHEARLEKLAPIETRRKQHALALTGTSLLGGPAVKSSDVVVKMQELVVGFPATLGTEGGAGADGSGGGPTPAIPVAKVPWLEAHRGMRIGIVGPNGAGKTTLLRTIAGELPPLDGRLTIGGRVQIGYLAQLRGAAAPGSTVLDALMTQAPITAGEARGYLARFLFRGDDVMKEVRHLSGGERSRLELAMLGLLPANLLIMDEPTNHLDIPAREALEHFLRETEATVLVISHDRRLLEQTCEMLWVVDNGVAAPFRGGYREWRAAVAEGWNTVEAGERELERLHGKPVAVAPKTAASGYGKSPASADAKKADAKAESKPGAKADSKSAPKASKPAAQPKLSKDAYRRQKDLIENDLSRLGLRKSHLELALSDPAILANFVEIRRVTSELADIDEAIGRAEEAWLVLEERAP